MLSFAPHRPTNRCHGASTAPNALPGGSLLTAAGDGPDAWASSASQRLVTAHPAYTPGQARVVNLPKQDRLSLLAARHLRKHVELCETTSTGAARRTQITILSGPKLSQKLGPKLGPFSDPHFGPAREYLLRNVQRWPQTCAPVWDPKLGPRADFFWCRESLHAPGRDEQTSPPRENNYPSLLVRMLGGTFAAHRREKTAARPRCRNWQLLATSSGRKELQVRASATKQSEVGVEKSRWQC